MNRWFVGLISPERWSPAPDARRKSAARHPRPVGITDVVHGPDGNGRADGNDVADGVSDADVDDEALRESPALCP